MLLKTEIQTIWNEVVLWGEDAKAPFSVVIEEFARRIEARVKWLIKIKCAD